MCFRRSSLFKNQRTTYICCTKGTNITDFIIHPNLIAKKNQRCPKYLFSSNTAALHFDRRKKYANRYSLAQKARKNEYFLCGLIFFSTFVVQNNGVLAQLARAFAWHAKGRRFDSDMLHKVRR